MADVESTHPPANGGADAIIDDGEEAESKVRVTHLHLFVFLIFF